MKRTIRRQKRKPVSELASGEREASVAENSQPENEVAGACKFSKSQVEKLKKNKSV